MADIAELMAGDDDLLAALTREGPINRVRAEEVMARFGVEAVVVGDPLNVFHILGYWPQIATTRLGQPPTTFAILPRDPAQPPAIVTSHFIYYYSFVDAGPRDAIPAYLFEAAGDAGEEHESAPFAGFFADAAQAPMTAVEIRRRDRTAAAANPGHFFRDAGGALARAFADLGLQHATLAYDHDVIRTVCERHERPGRLVPADNLLRWIRMVKSPLEIALMRRGAQANAAAVDAVIAQVRIGADYRDMRRLFDIETARRGNRSVFMTIDRVSSPLPIGDRIVEGQSLFFDGVSHFQNYHGDYARTVFVGDVSAQAKRTAKAATAGWEAIRERLRPGLRYAEISAIGQEVLRRTGAAEHVTFGPHSVGLMHTDEPGLEMGGFYGKQDLILEEGMVLSVDCPSLATGIGGSIHIEDLVLITADGAVPIHPIGDHVVTI
jgi:Xaa-Pro aminopeptidase